MRPLPNLNEGDANALCDLHDADARDVLNDPGDANVRGALHDLHGAGDRDGVNDRYALCVPHGVNVPGDVMGYDVVAD